MRWIPLQQNKPGGSTSMPQEARLYFACKAVIEGRTAPFVQGGILYDKKRAEEYVNRIEQEGRRVGSLQPLSEGRRQ